MPMITLDEFAKRNPQFAFDFEAPLRTQSRILDGVLLANLPSELAPAHPYRPGGRGRPNLNQTRTHSQCATCKRVLRNDLFYTPRSLRIRNVVYTHCRECAQQHNADRYPPPDARIPAKTDSIWRYLAPQCAICAVDGQASKLELHSVEGNDHRVVDLVTDLALSPDVQKVEKLLREAKRCVAVCAACHEKLHAGAISLPADVAPLRYNLATLLRLIRD
jgi:hypothetical protein